jgi:hypothetical protein
MANITLGFLNLPYMRENIQSPITAARIERRRIREGGKRKYYSRTRTTEQVSGYLENKYHILDMFWKKHEDDIEQLVSDIYEERLQQVMEGKLRIPEDNFARLARPAVPKIERMFRSFLDNREMDGMVSGVPVKAAIKGKKSALIHRKPGRQSFINTGLYRAAFRATVES